MCPPITPQGPDLEADVQSRQAEPGSDSQQPNGGVNRLGANEGPKYAPKHGDASATYWKLHGREAEIYDKNFVESLKGNTNSMVILNTLFSAIVAAFIIEIYKTLSPTSSQPTAAIPQKIAIRINIVLFLSFFLSIVSAVACALIQQWCYEYLKFAYPRTAPHERGRVRSYLFQGLNLNIFPMRRFVYGTHALLHISVILFFWAIGEFFYTVNHTFGLVIRYALVVLAIIYTLLSISPLVSGNSPYNTPMTPLLRAAFIILRIIIRLLYRFPLWLCGEPFDSGLTGLPYYKGIHFDTARFFSMEAEKLSKELEPHAMEWLFTENDFSDSDMDEFLKSLPGYIASEHTKKDLLDQYLTADHVLTRIKGHFITCATSMDLSDQACVARVSSCVKALVLIFQYSRKRKSDSPESGKLKKELDLQQTYIQELMDDFGNLCGMDDHTTALRASCIRALTVDGFLSQLFPSNSETTDRSQSSAPLIPLYNYLFPNHNTVPEPQLGHRPTPSTMEMSLLHDGRLANLTRLARAICDREHASLSTLSFCWKMLDILLIQLGTIHSNNPTRAQSDFDSLHEVTRKYVHGEEMGFRLMPLLEILDTVARGRRLLMVISGYPKYHRKATLVFGKEYLQNVDLLEAFASCLQDYISKSRPNDVSGPMHLMETIVLRDGLWSNLQTILWNIQGSISSTSYKFRVFDYCCNVLDAAFLVLNGSRKMDWRAPEFGSLWQHFESFIGHGFKGAFMGRATSVHIHIIKAQFCSILLAQFLDDANHKKVLSFLSQWDVASLAKLIHYLGLRDEDDPEFWHSHIDGGHIGDEFTAKALKMVDKVVRDGPLLIFCQLGRLATSTIPYNRSGLERKDTEKVLKLQNELMLDQLLPLNYASGIVWEDLDQLQEEVEDLSDAISGDTGDTSNAENAGEEGGSLQTLLQRIDDVRNVRLAMHASDARSEPSGTTASERASATSQNYTVLPRMFVLIPAFPLLHGHRPSPSPSTPGTRRLRENPNPSRSHSHSSHLPLSGPLDGDDQH